MPKKISFETKQLIFDLYAENVPISEIARTAKVSNMTVYGLTKLTKKINPETGTPFESLSQYHDYLIRQKLNPETGLPFKSSGQYNSYLVAHRKNPETGFLFETMGQYITYIQNRRLSDPSNAELGNLVKRKLLELQKSQSWLSKQLGVSRQAVSGYIQGRYAPSVEVLENLSSVISVSYRDLETLVN
jgi:hypothetical protein